MISGEQIREARLKTGLNQQEFTKEINKKYIQYGIKNKAGDVVQIRNTSVSNWEVGFSEPDADTIGIICEISNTEPNVLYGFKKSHDHHDSKVLYIDPETDRAYSYAPTDEDPRTWDELDVEKKEAILIQIQDAVTKTRQELRKD